jgi:hypothetical protein
VSSRLVEATEIMTRITQLYRVEALVNEVTPEDRRRVREERSTPIKGGPAGIWPLNPDVS